MQDVVDLPVIIKRHSTGQLFKSSYAKYSRKSYKLSQISQKYNGKPKTKRLNHTYINKYNPIDRRLFSPSPNFNPFNRDFVDVTVIPEVELFSFSPVTVYVEPQEAWEVVIQNLTDLIQNCSTRAEDLRKELQNIDKIKSKKDQDLKEIQEQLQVEQEKEKTKDAKIDELIKKMAQIKSDYHIAYTKSSPIRLKIMKLQQALKADTLIKKNLIADVYRN